MGKNEKKEAALCMYVDITQFFCQLKKKNENALVQLGIAHA